jgi:hypothetical protein
VQLNSAKKDFRKQPALFSDDSTNNLKFYKRDQSNVQASGRCLWSEGKRILNPTGKWTP